MKGKLGLPQEIISIAMGTEWKPCHELWATRSSLASESLGVSAPAARCRPAAQGSCQQPEMDAPG